MAKLRNELTSFQYQDGESLYDAWERFKDLLRKCPQHGLEMWNQIFIFYNGLSVSARQMIDAAAGGSLGSRDPQSCYDLIEEMAMNSFQWNSIRAKPPPKASGIFQVDEVTSLKAQLEALTQRMDQMHVKPVHNAQSSPVCDFCRGSHPSVECSITHEELDFISNQTRAPQNPYSDSYNPGWRSHPNFGWRQGAPSSNQAPPGIPYAQRPNQQYNQGPNQFTQQQNVVPQQQQQSRFNQQGQHSSMPPPVASTSSTIEDLLRQHLTQTTVKFSETDAALRNQQATLQNLESQIGQISKALSERTPGKFPSNTEPNPRAQANAITLRSGTTMVPPPMPANDQPNESKEQSTSGSAEEQIPNEGLNEAKPKLHPESTTQVKPPVPQFQPKMPYPQALRKEKTEEQYGKFLELFKQLHVNIPFVEALAQMPKYAKFLKDLLSNKKKLEDLSTVTLSEECSALLQNKLPIKKNDPGSFTIPCLIGNLSVNNALADLGASINLMPYSLFSKLGLGEPIPTRMSIQLADRSVKFPRGIVENILVKVDKFVFPVDFVILDMNEDKNVPLILGRPFLATSRALIDVCNGTLTLRVDKEVVTFDIQKSMKHSSSQDDTLYYVDNCDRHIRDWAPELIEKDVLDTQISIPFQAHPFFPYL